MRNKISICLIVYCLVFLSCKDEKTISVLQVKQFPDYPSASGIEYVHSKIYMMGDDAASMLVLDDSLDVIDSIRIFTSNEKRIPKDIKYDPESISSFRYNRRNVLLSIGSGSVSPYRDSAMIIDPESKNIVRIPLDTLYTRLRKEGIKDLNIEGVAAIPAGVFMAARGNKTFNRNFLVFIPPDFLTKQDTCEIRLIRTGVNTDTSAFSGISGLAYSKRTDRLYLTVSTENTYNSYADGTIGKSYLWIINDITGKRRYSAINPNRAINLDDVDPRFKGQKIESVCIIREDRKTVELLLAADDDKGGSALFRLRLDK